ncbi:E3 ubiquitin-protein ligase FANCL-like [Zophobas morio]|uniref:E3 ubiquitin-protein ligase FANCL-like n=1 Tax=Zophobas morio TaxID=2755281 RepID=UPI003083DDA9
MELSSLVESLSPPFTFRKEVDTDYKLCKLFYKDLCSIGWEYVSYVNELCTLFKFEVKDTGLRKHILSVDLTNYPEKTPEISTQLPTPFLFQASKVVSLLKIFKLFKEAIASYQDFWDSLQVLDSQTWALTC